ncbi:MAG TPA: M67 family metallopeptidase [Aggregatilineaceae bacterium]|nr:M67 family metallopeptidase [Aggregatilineaceae bacterium]
MKLVLPHALHTGIQRYLENAFPNEAGGFLIGRLDGENGEHPEIRVVTETRFAENIFETNEQYHRYLMEEEAFQSAEDYADEHNLILLGHFHSHPNSPAVPSEFDRVHALPNFVYLILSVQHGQAAESLVWLLADDRSRFDPVALEEDSMVISGG